MLRLCLYLDARIGMQVVVGVGRHSAGGQPRIQPAVKQALQNSGACFWQQHDNPGVIEVVIPPAQKQLARKA